MSPRLWVVLLFITLFSAVEPACAQDISTGLVGLWKLDETSGTTASDSSGNSRNGTYTNTPTLNQTGQSGTSVKFNGTNEYVTIADNDDFSAQTSTGLTVAAWVKVVAFATDGLSSHVRAPIIAKGTSSAYEWALYVYDNGNAGASFWQSSGSSHNEISGSTLSVGTWYHVAMTYDVGNSVKLYVNGALVSTGTTFSGTCSNTTSPVQIARRQDGEYLNSYIDDARIYKRALSANDIAMLYAMRMQLKLDETSGSTAADASPYQSTGTVTGTASWAQAVRYYGFNFNGATKIQATGLMGNPTNVSITAWANLTAADPSGAEVCSLGDHFLLRLEDSGRLVSYAYNGSTWVGVTYTASYIGAGWHHFAAVFDDTNNTYKLYVDGAQVASTSTSSSISWSGLGSNTVLGIHGNGGTTYDFTGMMDDVRVYAKALSAAEVAEIYGLVGYWKLDESSGTSAADSSGCGNTGTVHGTATWASGVVNNCFTANYHDGEDYIEIANSSSLENVQENSYSIACWYKPAEYPPGTGSQYNAAHHIVTKPGWHMGLTYGNTGNLYCEHWLGTNPDWYGTGAWYDNAPGSWYHICMVIDRDFGTIKFYRNSNLENTATFTAGAAAFDYGTNPFRIGIANSGSVNWGGPCYGSIDDVRIYNRAIPSTEVTTLYKMAPLGVHIIKWVETQ